MKMEKIGETNVLVVSFTEILKVTKTIFPLSLNVLAFSVTAMHHYIIYILMSERVNHS